MTSAFNPAKYIATRWSDADRPESVKDALRELADKLRALADDLDLGSIGGATTAEAAALAAATAAIVVLEADVAALEATGPGEFTSLQVTVAPIASAGETLAELWVTDAAGLITLANQNVVDARFSPILTAEDAQSVATGGYPTLELRAVVNTENTDFDYGAVVLAAGLTGGGQLSTQSLVAFKNGTERVAYLQPVSSSYPGAVAFCLDSDRDENPTFSGSGGRLSAGVRILLADTRAVAATDRAIGVDSYGPYISGKSTADTISFWLGTTRMAHIDGSGDMGIEGGFHGESGVIPAKYSAPNVIYTAGTGTPVGVFSAVVGSMWLRSDGSTGTTLYVKESGTGNTGWTAMQSTNGVVMSKGTGTPEAAVTGSPGDIFMRTDGGAGLTLYVKETGTATNTGWAAK